MCVVDKNYWAHCFTHIYGHDRENRKTKTRQNGTLKFHHRNENLCSLIFS